MYFNYNNLANTNKEKFVQQNRSNAIFTYDYQEQTVEITSMIKSRTTYISNRN